MDDQQDWQEWLRLLGAGDDEVAAEFWTHYGRRLQRLAANHLAPQLAGRLGPDDVVQSVCRTVLRRAKAGKIAAIDGGRMWGLLCAITLTKLRNYARFHHRQRRGIERESGQRHDRNSADLPGSEISPLEAAEFADTLERLLAGISQQERHIVSLKLEQFTNSEIAAQLHCSERTVRRSLKRVQAHLAEMLPRSDS